MLARNLSALIGHDFSQWHKEQRGTYAQQYLNDVLKINYHSKAFVPTQQLPLEYVFQDSINFYRHSGWGNFLEQVSTTQEAPLIVCPYSPYPMPLTPAFYKGKQYQIVFANKESAASAAMLDIKHKNIPVPAARIYNNMGVHILIDQRPTISTTIGFSSYNISATQLLTVMQQWINVTMTIHKKGWTTGLKQLYLIGWPPNVC